MREISPHAVRRIKNLWIFKGNASILINPISGDTSTRLKMYEVLFVQVYEPFMKKVYE